ncbi:MAG: hypothetical protein RR824_08615, partial [Clostridia bacterium]
PVARKAISAIPRSPPQGETLLSRPCVNLKSLLACGKMNLETKLEMFTFDWRVGGQKHVLPCCAMSCAGYSPNELLASVSLKEFYHGLCPPAFT